MNSDDQPRLMGDFFDRVAHDYDVVHTSHIDRGEEHYLALSSPIAPTMAGLKMLNIGCGTGLELAGVLKKIPNAHIHCIDLSRKMLDILEKRYRSGAHSISTELGSYLNYEYPPNEYDYVMASGTLHHLLDEEKLDLYPRLLNSMMDGGCLIVGDYFVSAAEAKNHLDTYRGLLSKGIDLKRGKYHIDIPTTCDNEKTLLSRSGFGNTETIWESSNHAIIVAKKSFLME
ncbi:MAG: class I SAM-dependent methyltransferase [Proteobacteria bacterium]|nr:class I SAM-dependent methyltransferase [Pseudomonadota bacterium]